MPLENFFREGNKAAVFGSIIYLPETATDIDFALFTKGSFNPYETIPNFYKEISAFLNSQLGISDLRLDFEGPREKKPSADGLRTEVGVKRTYDRLHLPADDRLNGIFLSGRFFPSDDFLKDHYRQTIGEDYLEKIWLKYALFVQEFESAGSREDKKHKDISLLIRATHKIAETSPRVFGIARRFDGAYKSLSMEYKSKRLSAADYTKIAAEMVPRFIAEVRLALGS